MLNLFFKTFFSLSLGAILSIFIAQNDPAIQHYLAQKFATLFEQSLDCKLFYEVKSVNLFIPRITLKNVHVYPNDQAPWQWHAKEYATSFSWFHFVCNGTLNLQIELNTLNASSAVSAHNLAIWPHILKMVQGSTEIPLFVKTIEVKKARATLIDADKGMTYHLAWNSQTRTIGSVIKSQTQITNGSLLHNTHTYSKNLNGSLSFDITQNNANKSIFHGEMKASTTINPGFSPSFLGYISATWHPDDTISASMHTSDPQLIIQSLSFKPFVDHCPLQCTAQMPILYAQFFFPYTFLASFNGIAHIDLSTQLPNYDTEWKAQITTQDILFNSACCSTKTTTTAEKKDGEITILSSAQVPFLGPVQIDATIHSDHSCTLRASDQTIDCATMIDYQNSVIRYHLEKEDFSFHGACPDDQITSANGILDYRGQPTIVTQLHSSGGICASSSIAQLQPLFKHFLGYEVDGQGIIDCKLWYENNLINGEFELAQGALRLPYTYNHINNLKLCVAYDYLHQKLYIKECVAQLYKGKVVVSPSTIALSGSSLPSSWHMPILLDSCVLTLQQGMFAIVSGSLLNEKQPGKIPSIRGHIIIDRAQLNEHLLSAQWLRSLIATVPGAINENSPDIACDITLETKEPIRVKTDMLQTEAIVKLRVTGTVLKPEVSGTIQLHGGQFSLTYKPLYITKALLTFDPHNVYDPHIELVAKNNIKKHNVTLQIMGSLHHPQIMLESSPPLTDDQIVNLLVTGTQEKSLGAAIPTLIIQSLKKLIFGEQTTTIASEHINRLLKPLNRVHLIPRFADQTGRGGLRAAVEVDITDRLSVLLQKNFSLWDDTRLEVEYMLSDDISLRGVRDERKDVTGEVEMKWKF